jgi:hypothetical protein
MQSIKFEITEIQKRLNSDDILPDKAFRRDKFNYPLVSLVNNITGCFLSENYKPIPILIDRALVEFESNNDPCPNYKELVFKYFKLMVKYLIEIGFAKNNELTNILEQLNGPK